MASAFGELFDPDGNAFEFREFSGSQPACADDDFVLALFERTHQQRFQDSLRLETGCQFFELLFIEALAGISG